MSLTSKEKLSFITSIAAFIGCTTGVASLVWNLYVFYSPPIEIMTASYQLRPHHKLSTSLFYTLELEVSNVGKGDLYIHRVNVTRRCQDSLLASKELTGSFQNEPLSSGASKIFQFDGYECDKLVTFLHDTSSSNFTTTLIVSTPRGMTVEARPEGVMAELLNRRQRMWGKLSANEKTDLAELEESYFDALQTIGSADSILRELATKTLLELQQGKTTSYNSNKKVK